jgi:SAM-dependent methyltransferase
MLRTRGPRLPIGYFLNAQLFDLRFGVETHQRLAKDRFESRPQNFDHGVLYRCSWTSEVRWVFERLRSRLAEASADRAFVDVGCGKRKAVLVWTRLCRAAGVGQDIRGIDYYAPFVEVAARNHERIFREQARFELADAAAYDFEGIRKPLILYLYDPFDEALMVRVLERPKGTPAIIAYNNPVHLSVVECAGFSLLERKRGFHPNADTALLARPA